MSDEPRMLVKLVIIDQKRRVLTYTAGTSSNLPKITIPRFSRIGYSATVAARERYGLELFNILSVEANSEEEDLVLVCRLQDPGAALSDHFRWFDAKQVQFGELDSAALAAAMKEFEPYDSGVKASSFGRYISLDELRAWYVPHLKRIGVRETGIQQWNGDPWFALFRVGVEPVGEAVPETPKALWFKAVGKPNTREFAVTVALTQECPYWFPRIIATKPEWNGWLMEEVEGHELDGEADELPWALTARVLAKVQKRFIGKENELLALGCRDWRMPSVLASLDPFFADMEEIMQRQPSELPRILDRCELRKLKIHCHELCHRVEDVDVPYTITHGDFSPHNVIISNGSPVLIDWAEAYIGFPFISWEYFWNRMVKDHPEHADWHKRMHRNYAHRVWASLLTPRRVTEGLRLSPAMAVLVLALYGIDDPEQRQNRRLDRVKRSLVRRLQREIGLLRSMSAESVGAL